ncbi:MAG TPA: hypothetical protein PKD46_14140 [Aggregatilineaceae bacterium]|nr:hypothetical protein [Anaerolineae bacterium]HMM29419.1 hypothetical protein [Aggregatilineaceae bacterium]
MPEVSQDTLLYAAGGLFALALLLLVVSLRLFRRSRRDVFWRRRREAGQRGWRLFLLAFVLFAVSGITCASTLVISAMRQESPPDETPIAGWGAGSTPLAVPSQPALALEAVAATTPLDLIVTPAAPAAVASPTGPGVIPPSETATMQSALLPTNTPVPPVTVIVTVIATPGDTPTQTPFPTYTPNAPPLVAAVTPRPDARLQITALDDEVSATLSPVSPASSFPAGTERVYLFVSFENMTQGVLWRRELYRDDELVETSSYLWGLPTSGRTSFFVGSDPGFAPGRYEVRLYLGEATSPASHALFTITAPDVG